MASTSRGPGSRSTSSGPRSSASSAQSSARRSRPGRAPSPDGPSGRSATSQARVRGPEPAPTTNRPAPAPRASLTTRAAVLLGVVGLLAASYAFPLRAWLDQRSELAAAESERAALQREVDGLTDAVAAWDDPAYVRAQARERLNFVLPGEVGLVVLGTEATPADPVESTGAVVPEVAQDQPWWTGLVAAFYEVGNATPADTSADPAAAPGQPGSDAASEPGTTAGESPALP